MCAWVLGVQSLSPTRVLTVRIGPLTSLRVHEEACPLLGTFRPHAAPVDATRLLVVMPAQSVGVWRRHHNSSCRVLQNVRSAL